MVRRPGIENTRSQGRQDQKARPPAPAPALEAPHRVARTLAEVRGVRGVVRDTLLRNLSPKEMSCEFRPEESTLPCRSGLESVQVDTGLASWGMVGNPRTNRNTLPVIGSSPRRGAGALHVQEA